MWKRLLPVVLLSTALLLTGCITIEIQNVIKPDGSGEKVMINALDKDTYDMMMSVTPEEGAEAETEDPFKSTYEACEKDPRATCEKFVDEDRELIGVRASLPFDSLDELAELSSSPVFNNADEITFERGGRTTTMHIVVHTKDVSSEVAEGSGELEETPEPQATLTPEQQQQMEQLLEMMDIEFYYRVTAPAPVTDYGPQENAKYDEETNTVSWKIDLMAEEPAQELWVSWGGAPVQVEPTARPTEAPTREPSTRPTAVPTAEATPAPSERTGPGKMCSCLPSLTLPALGLGAVLAARRRRGAGAG